MSFPNQFPQAAPASMTHSSIAAILNPAVPPDLADLALLDIKTLEPVVGLKSSAIHDRVRRHEFPEPVRIGQRCTRWTVASIKQWLQEQITAQQDDIKQRQQARAKKASNAAQAKRHAIAQQGDTQ